VIHDASLVKEIDLRDFGGIAELFAVPQSGEVQLLWLQSMGMFMSQLYPRITRGFYNSGAKRLASRILMSLGVSSPRLNPFRYLRDANRDLSCLTASDSHGRVLWQHGHPEANRYYCSHQGEGLLTYADLNSDGQNEILAIYAPGRLGVFSSQTGELLKERRLPADNFNFVKVGKAGPEPTDCTIYVGVTEAPYGHHTYSNPLLLLDASLNEKSRLDLPGGVGHTLQVFDADGDDCDEALAGYSLIDHDGSLLWTAEGFESCTSNSHTALNHADWAVIIRGRNEVLWFAVIAGSQALYCFDCSGRLLWRRSAIHSQYILSGNFGQGSDELQLFHLQCRHKMECLDLRGNLVWEGKLPANWPHGRPSGVVSDDLFHMGRPAAVWHDPLRKGQDLIVYNEAGWPYAVDGCGNVRVQFPTSESSRQNRTLVPPPGARPDDYGYGYHTLVADVDMDGREEVLIHDRDFAWLYKAKSSQ
jgi:hypothetical protein